MRASASLIRCEPTSWHAISCVVDAIAGVMRTYIDGVEVAEIKEAKVPLMVMDGDGWPLIATDCEIEEANVYGDGRHGAV